MTTRPLRLGLPVKVLGAPELKSNDTRRWANAPHLKTSLEYLARIFDYLHRHRIDMYRMSSDLAPYVTHPDMPQFHGMIAESANELRALGRKARELDLRLSFHPSQFIVLNSPDPALVQKSVWDLSTQAEMLDLMELGPEAVVVIHVGGAYGDRRTSARRWVETWSMLPEHIQRRLVLEHDDLRFSSRQSISSDASSRGTAAGIVAAIRNLAGLRFSATSRYQASAFAVAGSRQTCSSARSPIAASARCSR
jgi:UV DNA damage endonuclease